MRGPLAITVAIILITASRSSVIDVINYLINVTISQVKKQHELLNKQILLYNSGSQLIQSSETQEDGWS